MASNHPIDRHNLTGLPDNLPTLRAKNGLAKAQNEGTSWSLEKETELRRSERLQLKDLASNILFQIDVVSNYHQMVTKELRTKEDRMTDLSKLEQIHTEMTEQSTLPNILAQFEDYKYLNKEGNDERSKSIVLAIDRVNADRVQLIKKVQYAINNRTACPKDTTILWESQTSQYSTGSNQSKSSNKTSSIVSNRSNISSHSSKGSSRSSRLAELAAESLAELARKESQLETEIATLKMEEEMAALDQQKAALDQHKAELDQQKAAMDRQKEEIRRSMRSVKAMGELEAERRKHAILLQAAEEEIQSEQTTNLLQHPTIKDYQAKDQQKEQHQAELQTDSPTSQPNPMNIASKRTQSIETFKRASDHVRIPTANHPRTPDIPEYAQTPTNQSLQSTSSIKLEHALLAEALADAINDSKLPPPQPFVFKGDLLNYMDWKTSFFDLVDKRRGKPAEKLALLKTYVSENIRELISGYCTLGTEDAYSDALETLEEHFGNEYQLGEAFIQKLECFSRINNNDGPGLRIYLGFLKQCAASMSKISTLEDLNTVKEMRKIISKLPLHLERKWIREATIYHENHKRFPNLAELCKFLKLEVRIACNPLNPNCGISNSKDLKTKKRTIFNTTTTDHATSCDYCNSVEHDLAMCSVFSSLPTGDREQYVRRNRLCYGCLEPGHMTKECKDRASCQTCNKPHPTSMHQERPKFLKQKQGNDQNRTQLEDPKENNEHISHDATNTDGSRTGSMTVPVWVSSAERPEQEVLVYALLDTQSDSSYITGKVANQISSKMENTTINLSTMTSKKDKMDCMKIKNISVRAYSTQDKATIRTAYTIKSIPAIRNHIPTTDAISKWPHLQHVAKQMNSITEEIPIGLLIGYDTPSVFKPTECVSAGNDEPYAVKTLLGWVVMGAISAPRTCQLKINHRLALTDIPLVKPIALTQQQRNPSEDFKEIIKALSMDFTAIIYDTPTTSIDDRIFLETLSNGIHQDSEGYITMPLPLKGKPKMSNSKAVALHRFNILAAKMKKDSAYKDQYHKFIEGVINRHEAERVPTEEVNNPSWYLPHFGVFHPKKPEKIRVVFDASAKVDGVCLNDYLLEGPAHINNLQGILIRFRKNNVAIMCDIEKMFHNFRITKSDRDLFRFLWYNEKGEITDYRMRVHIFGAKSSPGCATFGLRHLANSSKEAKEVTSFITDNFYVDDGVTSVEDSKSARALIEGARRVCETANLRLHKFVSNDIRALMDLPQTEITENAIKIDLRTDLSISLVTERTLGLQWDIKEDSFRFLSVDNNRPSTKRGVLATVASLFDPLGLVSPFVLQGKSILQSLCKEKIDWDAPLNTQTQSLWEQWKQNMTNLEELKIPRCYTPKHANTIIAIEIHNFSDASTIGYGQCSYLRTIDDTGDIHLSLLMSKARVAPLKVVSIPRLELQAACTSVEVSKFLKEQLQVKKLKEIFWTDSKVVLAYINNDARRFHVYVANRVQKIRNYSEPKQWHYVPTDMNPADIASRGANPTQLKNSCWFNGPEFLQQEPIQLLHQSASLVSLDEDNDLEVKTTTTLLTQTACNPLHKRMEVFSSWNTAVESVALLQQVIRSKRGQRLDIITARQKAEICILNSVQEAYYGQEMKGLESDKPVKRNSPIDKLCPIMDDNRLLRVGGRLQGSTMSFKEKHPIILPKGSHISKLIIDHYHARTAHQGRGFTLAKMRAAGYWVVGAHSMIASFIYNCYMCRKNRGKLMNQQMSPLPVDRTEASPPFSYIGVDCFGPFIVKDGRKDHKRWGLLVTCMASRAIHIEVLEDMSTDAFLNALRTLISIRGAVRQIRSDRGSNFTGALSELFKLQELHHNTWIKENRIEFVFNPPHASHMGGAWERQIRTVRSVLKAISGKYGGRFSTSTLRVAMYEIMAVVNCRPLGIVSEEQVPLTPNMLLTMKSDISLPPPGRFEDSDCYSKKRWIQVQAIANQFWKRYRVEYLQQLQARNKWIKPCRNLQMGDIVCVNEGDSMRNDWRLAKVTECQTSTDGFVRSVKLLMGSATLSGKRVYLERPVTKLILLVEAKQRGSV